VVSMAMQHLGQQTVAVHVLVHLVFRPTHLLRVAERFQDLDTYVSAEKVMRDVCVNGESAEFYKVKALLRCYM